jgi:cytochrome P450
MYLVFNVFYFYFGVGQRILGWAGPTWPPPLLRPWKHEGIYMQLSLVYVVADLDYVKNIMTRGFEYFPHRGLYYNEESDPLSAHIFNLSGEKWRNLRTMLNPIFTPNRMKKIFPILTDCETVLRKNVELQVAKEKPINVKNTVEGRICLGYYRMLRVWSRL